MIVSRLQLTQNIGYYLLMNNESLKNNKDRSRWTLLLKAIITNKSILTIECKNKKSL